MVLTESMVIAASAGIVAVILSRWTTRLFGTITPLPNLSLRFDLAPDLRFVGFAALVTLAARGASRRLGFRLRAARASSDARGPADRAQALVADSTARARLTIDAATTAATSSLSISSVV